MTRDPDSDLPPKDDAELSACLWVLEGALGPLLGEEAKLCLDGEPESPA